ncbi:hypothetical protein LGT39_06965 [Demequina sp. TTPB684]|uniref:hypothetical protein n=1 Tax=unclassified Demequina TaxID=2620311 RepID=UPI001CF0F42E|nr:MULTISPECIES: hypothetical protein [unclassified Demequina]MCB2412589.1 hypothetical protein [Demequina sp. TTPB684]UPU89544.1 hypothetical protein LGT36_006350 [Demequina sp. TMPB413]
MTRAKQFAMTAAALVALSGAACASNQDDASDATRICPQTLPVPPTGADVGTEYADQLPDIAKPEAAWLCQYTADTEGVPGADAEQQRVWTRVGEPAAIPSDKMGAVDGVLRGLVTLPDDVVCTLDFGPRWLVAFQVDDELWGATVDSYGCHEVRLTDDPFTVAPGFSSEEKLVRGALGSPPGIVDELKSAAGVN